MRATAGRSRVADRQTVPIEQPRHRGGTGDVLEEERRRTDSAEHDGRLEAPQLVGLGRAAPAAEEILRRAPCRLGAVDEPGHLLASLGGRADRQPFGAHDGDGQSVQRCERLAHRRRGSAARGQVRRVDAVSGQEGDDDRTRLADTRFAEELGCAEREQLAHAGRERAQRAGLGGEFGRGIRLGRSAHDDTAAVLELGDRGVVATGGALGQQTCSDDAYPRESRGHRRG